MTADRARHTRDAMRRAIRRLNALEYLILGAAALLALAGGALVGWIGAEAAGLSFRLTWGAASLLLFVLPGVGVYLRERRKAGGAGAGDREAERKEGNG